jgi:hypothetical protein
MLNNILVIEISTPSNVSFADLIGKVFCPRKHRVHVKAALARARAGGTPTAAAATHDTGKSLHAIALRRGGTGRGPSRSDGSI